MKRFFLSILPVGLLLSCNTINVVSFYNEQVDFGKYTTFRIINPANRNEKLSEKNLKSDQNIENAIKREMNFLGYTYDESSELKIYYRLILDSQVDYRVNDSYRSYPSYNYPYYSVSSTEYKEGILMVEMKDASSRKTLWQGSLDLKIKSRKKTKTDALQEAMRLIFEEYPFQAGKSEPQLKPDES